MGASISVVSMVTGWIAIFVAIFVAPVTGPILTRWLNQSRLGKYLGSEPPPRPRPTNTDRALLMALLKRQESDRALLERVTTRLETLVKLSKRQLELSERQLAVTNSQAVGLASPEGLTAEIRFRRAPRQHQRTRADTE